MTVEELKKLKNDRYQEYLSETLDLIFDGKEEIDNVSCVINSSKYIDEGNGVYFVYNEKVGKYTLYNEKKDIFVGEYDEVYGFHDGYSRVAIDGEYFFIDEFGNLINGGPYDDAYDFYNGVVWVKISDRWYLKNKSNQIISDKNGYEHVNDFHEGYAVVIKNRKYYYIDTDGKIVNKTAYDYATDFNYGEALTLKLNDQDITQIINTKFEIITELDGNNRTQFKDKWALIRNYLGKWEYYYFNSRGQRLKVNIKTKPNPISSFYSATEFNNGMAAVQPEHKGSVYIINMNGDVIHRARNLGMGSLAYFYNGFLRISYRHGSMGCSLDYRDWKGENRKFLNFDYVINGPNSLLTLVKKNDKYFYLDYKGDPINDETYDKANPFNKNGYAKVENDNKKYYINLNGMIIPSPNSNTRYIFHTFKVKEKNRPLIKNEDISKEIIGYKYRNLTIKYRPVADYGIHILCIRKNKYYLYDVINNKYTFLGRSSNITYNNHLIYLNDNINEELYLMTNKAAINITSYIEKIRYKGKLKFNKNIELLDFDTFCYKNIELFDEDIKKRKAAQKKLEEEQRKIKNQHDTQKNREYISETIAKKRQMKKLVDKGIKTFQDKIAELSELKSWLELNKDNIELDEEKVARIKELCSDGNDSNDSNNEENSEGKPNRKLPEDFLVDSGNHKKINPNYQDILISYDLSGVIWEDVDIRETNFSYTNAILNPQEVYMKSLEGCTFKGISFAYFTNFSGVNISRCKFYICHTDNIPDIFESNFAGAIYNENEMPLINDIPINEYFKDITKENIKIKRFNKQMYVLY